MSKIGAALRAEGTLVAKEARRIGSIPGFMALKCADIGEATLPDGQKVTITWGRNLAPEEQRWFSERTSYKPVWVGADSGSAELIIDAETAQILKSIMIVSENCRFHSSRVKPKKLSMPSQVGVADEFKD